VSQVAISLGQVSNQSIHISLQLGLFKLATLKHLFSAAQITIHLLVIGLKLN